ncbi:MAG: hypothetical protein KDI44_01560 [Thiothrix sp.]|nr:hypothetical protein [Thiothrix sp.]HPQ93975.1 hypothetical protein [Thiolinea sp.]
MKQPFILTSLLVTSGVMGQAIADELSGPDVYGKLRVQQESLNNGKDDGFRVGQAMLGIKGTLTYDNFKANYALEAEFSDLANPDNASDSNEARIRTARIVVPTANIGTFVMGRTTSGVRTDVYGHLDIFENTETYNPVNGSYTQSSGLTAQPLYAPGVFAWRSPSFAGFYISPSILSTNDANGKSVDGKSVRVVYKRDGFKAAASIVDFDKTIAGDYQRKAVGASYTADNWQIGATHETDPGHPSGDYTVNAVAGRYKVTPKMAVNLGYFKKDHDNNALDNAAVIGNVTYTLGGNPDKGTGARLFLEHEEHDLDPYDKTTLGLSLGF